MKIPSLALVAALAASGDAFVSQSSTGRLPTAQKMATRKEDNWFAPPMAAMVAAMAGWSLAAQLAVAATVAEPPVTMLPDMAVIEQIAPSSKFSSSSNLLLGFGAPSSVGGTSFETLDFSLPSYSESTGGSGDSSVKSSPAPPAFTNPFGSSTADKEVADEAPPAAAVEKVDKKAARAEKQAAEAAAKAEQDAAADKAKAEKAARRQAELEKQRAMVDRAAAEKKATADKEEPKIPPFVAPEVKAPEVKAPEVKLPEIKKPDVAIPSFSAPKFEAPKFEAPKFETPKFETPKFEAPKFEAPKFEAPKFEVPKFEAPKFDAPQFSLPKVEAPSFKAPELPKVSIPSFSSDTGASDVEEFLEPQEVRDERARAARNVFNEADDEAKAVEQKAKEMRSIANEKKEIAKAAKDEACKTRWGGKILCLRPFGTGY